MYSNNTHQYRAVQALSAASNNLTRRGVLAAAAGSVPLLVAGGAAAGSQTGVSSERDGWEPRELARRWHSAQQGETASEHCPPTSFEQDWESPVLQEPGSERGISSLTVPADDEFPAYVTVSSVQTPEGANIYALDSQTGEILDGWPKQTGGLGFLTFLFGGSNDLLAYVDIESQGNAILKAVDPVTGTQAWEQSIPASGGFVPINYDPSRDLAFVTTAGPTVTAIDTTNGEVEWEAEIRTNKSTGFAVRQGESLYITAGPTGPNGSAVLLSVDLGSGVSDREEWSVSRDVFSSYLPFFTEDVVATVFTDPSQGESEIVAVDSTDGSELWSDSRSSGKIWRGIFISENSSLYAFASNTDDPPDTSVARFDPESGTAQWEVDATGTITGFDLGEKSAYATTQPGNVFRVNDDPESDGFGTQTWQRSLTDDDEITNADVTVACGTVYTGTTEFPGPVYALDADDGTTLDTFTVDNGVVGRVFSRRGSIWTNSTPDLSKADEPGENRIYRLGAGSDDPPSEGVTLSFDPTAVDLDVDQNGETGLVVEGAGNGVGAYQLTVTVGDASVATISDVTPTAEPASRNIDVASDGSEASVFIGMGDNGYESSEVTVFSLELTGESTGSTTVTLEDVDVQDTEGNIYDTAETGSVDVTVEAAGPPPIAGDNPPTDPDSDGLYEDIDGDGELTIGDVQLLLENRNADVIQNNAAAFNFSNSGGSAVTLADIKALYEELSE